VRRIILTAFYILDVFTTLSLTGIAPAGAQLADTSPKVKPALVASVKRVVQGRAFEVGLRQVIKPNWHTYWKNPGDSGEPTRISWELPDGFKASEIVWPMPEALPYGPLTNYGYSNEVLLPVTITPPAELHTSEVTLTAKATWLVCEKICIPESATLSITIPVASDEAAVQPSSFASMFDMARRNRPLQVEWPVSAHKAGAEELKLRVDAPSLDAAKIQRVEFFPTEWGLIDHAAPQSLRWYKSGFVLKLKPGELARATPAPDLNGILVITERIAEEGVVRNGFRLVTRIQDSALDSDTLGAEVALGTNAAPTTSGITIWQAIIFAVLGGVILNVMPCVLPILSLKVMSLAQHSEGSPVRGGLAYLTGVMVSFAVLAVILLSLKAVGASVGWGFQFQSPMFVLAMIALFFALGLSMSGVFDIGGNIVGIGESLTRRSGLAGSFFTGMLATIAATPCTAPFMGAAVGYALTRSSFETVVVLLALGLGFAAPVVALSSTDAARRVLPKPGPWMEILKQALAFPLYATVAWLAWVLSHQAGSDGVLATGIVLIGIGFTAWIVGRPIGALNVRLALAAVIMLGAILLLPNLSATRANVTSLASKTSEAGVDMDGAERFSLATVELHRNEGRAVFVNLTAAWCISCKVNERVALSTKGFKDALSQHNISYLKGDWTNRNEEIAGVLRAFGRAGVPLYLLYPANTAEKPIILPQILTEAIVIQYFASLDRAALSHQ